MKAIFLNIIFSLVLLAGCGKSETHTVVTKRYATKGAHFEIKYKEELDSDFYTFKTNESKKGKEKIVFDGKIIVIRVEKEKRLLEKEVHVKMLQTESEGETTVLLENTTINVLSEKNTFKATLNGILISQPAQRYLKRIIGNPYNDYAIKDIHSPPGPLKVGEKWGFKKDKIIEYNKEKGFDIKEEDINAYGVLKGLLDLDGMKCYKIKGAIEEKNSKWMKSIPNNVHTRDIRNHFTYIFPVDEKIGPLIMEINLEFRMIGDTGEFNYNAKREYKMKYLTNLNGE